MKNTFCQGVIILLAGSKLTSGSWNQIIKPEALVLMP